MFYKKNKIALFLLLAVSALSLYAWWNHKQKQEELRLNFERARTQKALLEAGIQSAKIQAEIQKHQQIANTFDPEDTTAPHELSNDAEVAQARLWLSLSKEKRAIMQTETINAGLAEK